MSRLAFLSLLLFLTSCATSRPTSYYVLNGSPVLEREVLTGKRTGRLLELGPITLPGYLDRKGIVHRTDSNTLFVSDLHHWGEPLEENIARALKSSLESCSAFQRIELYPYRGDFSPRERIKVSFQQFERIANSNVRAEAEVEWIRSAGEIERVSFPLALEKTCPDSLSYPVMIGCLESLLISFAGELCRQVS